MENKLEKFDRVKVIKEDIGSFSNVLKAGHVGMITDVDLNEEYPYKVTFADNTSDWFKGWHLRKVQDEK